MVGFLTELDAYVTAKCNGDRPMLISSGFYISSEKGEVLAPIIGKLDVELGLPGIVTTRIKQVLGTYQYATEPPTSATSWHSEGRVQAQYTFNGLASGKTY